MPCLAAMLAASAATAQPGGSERLVSSALPGFVTGYAAANAQQSIKEEIPRSKTVQAWTRMVTTSVMAASPARRRFPNTRAMSARAGPHQRDLPGGSNSWPPPCFAAPRTGHRPAGADQGVLRER